MNGEWGILFLSLRVAAISTALLLPLAVATGWLLARGRFRGKALVESLVHLPLVLPPVVTGYLLLIALGPRGAVGEFLESHLGMRLAFSWIGAVAASMVMAFPLMVRSIRLAVELVPTGLEQAARTLGSGRIATFLRVTLPLSLPGILAGAVLAFTRSLGEFGATITFAGNIAGETRTLPLAVFSSLQTPGAESATLRLVGLAIALSVGALLASELMASMLRRRLQGAA